MNEWEERYTTLEAEHGRAVVRICDLEAQLREAEKSLAVLREIKDVIQRQQNG